MPPAHQVIGKRYEVQYPPIGQGGMGVVYKAYDSVTRRYVALKTLRGGVDQNDLHLFEKEWTVLARISHPNIVDILDTGDFLEDGQSKPYFVMPLLPGTTLDQLVHDHSQRLTVHRTIEIICQACRGLQAAHDQGLVHRDLKPSNIFVMDDDAVKIIDFGVVHLSDTRSFTGIKGTLDYMAPEQMQLKSATAQSDIFSLGVVAYEALTGQRPFAQFAGSELVEAIRTFIPPPAGDLNPNVNQMVSRTIHKAMAKQPYHRFATAREFAETLQKAMRGEPIERFATSLTLPRMERIKKAMQDGDSQFAQEILTELESEGHIDPEMPALRAAVDKAVSEKAIRELLDSARTRFEEQEYPLALQKVQEVLDLDPSNVEAITIKSKIERYRSEKQLGTWFQLVRQHLESRQFNQARQGIDEIFKISPSDSRARELLREIDRAEQDDRKRQSEKEQLYEAAMASYRSGEISTAMSKLERALELARHVKGGTSAGTDAQYESLYSQIRQEHQQAQVLYKQGRQLLDAREYSKAIALCETHLAKNAADPLFQALKLEAEEMERQEQTAAIGDVNSRLDSEKDLDRKVQILEDASERYPKEPHFKQSLKILRDRRNLVTSILTRAKQLEERGQFSDSLAQWEIVRSIYPLHPGLDGELARLKEKNVQQERASTKATRMADFERLVALGDYAAAHNVAMEAATALPGDSEVAGLVKLADQKMERSNAAKRLLDEGQILVTQKDFVGAVPKLREAVQLDEQNAASKAALQSALLEQSRSLLNRDWPQAEALVNEALQLSPGDPVACSIAAVIQEHRTRGAVTEVLAKARQLQASGDAAGALAALERGLAIAPRDQQLRQLELTLHGILGIPVRRDMTSAGSHSLTPADPTVAINPLGETIIQPPSSPITPLPIVRDQSEKPPSPSSKAALGAGAAKVIPESAPPVNRVEPVAKKQVQPASPGSKSPEKKRPWAMIGVVAGIAVVAGAIGVTQLSHKQPAAPAPPPTQAAPGQISVEISKSIAAARVTVDGQAVTGSGVSLKPGRHQIAAELGGYLPFSQTINVLPTQQQPLKVEIALVPAPASINITSGLKNGIAVLDNETVNLQEGNLIRGDIKPGDHTLKILDNGKELVSFAFNFQPAALVDLHGPLQTRDVPAVVVSSMGQTAKIWTSPGIKGARGNASPQAIAPEGLTLDNIAPGNDGFVVEDGKTTHSLAIDASPTPILTVTLGSERPTGTIVVHANVPDAKVMINGVALKRGMANGIRIVSLDPSSYKVKVTAPGFQESAEQAVEIKQGDSKNLQFVLLPVVLKGVLALDKFPPDTEVLVDGVKVGSTSGDGAFKTDVIAGSHSLTFRKSGYEDTNLTREFRGDGTLSFSGDILSRAMGSLTFHVNPATAKLSYRRDGETQTHDATNGQTVSLRPGTYEVTAEADKYKPREQSVTVQSGKVSTVELVMATLEKHETNNGRTIANTVQAPAEWTVVDGWWQHVMPDYGWFRINQGELTLDILRQSTKTLFIKKSKRVEWAIDYQNAANQVVYTMDEHQLHRRATVGGVAGPEVKVPHGMEALKVYRVKIDVTPEKIIVRDRTGKVLDQYDRPKPDVPLGKLGFRGEVAISLAELR